MHSEETQHKEKKLVKNTQVRTVYIDLGSVLLSSQRCRCEDDACLKLLSLTCSVDHALGCCRRSGKNVWCAASSGCSASGGRAHCIDWQAARRGLFDGNHNAPVTNETEEYQSICKHKTSNRPQWDSASTQNNWEHTKTSFFHHRNHTN